MPEKRAKLSRKQSVVRKQQVENSDKTLAKNDLASSNAGNSTGGVTDDHVHDTGNSEQDDVLGENFGGVLGTNQASFQHGKACRHPHYQRAGNQEIKCIQRVAQILDTFYSFHNKFLSVLVINSVITHQRRFHRYEFVQHCQSVL